MQLFGKGKSAEEFGIRPDEGLTLETTARQSPNYLVNSVDKTKHLFSFPTDAAPQFLQKLTPIIDLTKIIITIWPKHPAWLVCGGEQESKGSRNEAI